MEMMNLIGYIDELDKVSMEVVRQGSVHIVNALNEINQNNFTIMTSEQNTNALMDLYFIKPYTIANDYSSVSDKLNQLMDIFGIQKKVKKKHVMGSFEYEGIFNNTEYVYKQVLECCIQLNKIKEEQKKTREFQEDMDHIKGIKLDFDVLKHLNFFSFKIGKLSKENYDKLKNNIENVSSIIYEVNSIPGYQVIISLTPRDLEVEVERIFRSLNYEELAIPYDFGGTPADIIKKLDEKIREHNEHIKKFEDRMLELKNEFATFIDESYSRIRLYEKIQSINSEVACTKEFFYMAGWVPVSQKENLQKRLAGFGDGLILVFKPESEVSRSIVPPTSLKNNWLVRPFESLVRMYGTPSYNELDPTSFVAISYMVMFGSMFGDIGQGFIFLLAGMLLSLKMHRPNFGGILSRIGLSSMVFGALFGSVFGNEEIFEPLLFHPMENISTVLLGGVVIGIVFTTVGFIYSLINAIKRRDIEDGVFGKDGLVGLLFYWITLLTALEIYKQGNTRIPLLAIIITLCMLLGLMVLKQPVANLLSGRKPLYHEPVQDYYIESGFGVLETLLSMLSNTISFIRVGAFALNHVGLFVAFATIAHMMKNSTGSVAVMVLGNIIIIGLEGLIVFIQGLRLEYYELFSKYYNGEGIEYNPIRLLYTSKNEDIDLSKKIDYEKAQYVNA